MYLLYRLFFLAIVIVGAPYLFLRAVLGKHGVKERLGFLKKRKSLTPLYWFHAASVGELKIVLSVVSEVKKLDPAIEIAVSTTTVTGKRKALEIFGEKTYVFNQPVELRSAVRRVLKNLRPAKLIVVETELWPVMLETTAKLGVKLCLVNGRISDRSFKYYKFFKPLFRPILRSFSEILTQSQIDAHRFSVLGAVNPKVVGNVKFDQILKNGEKRMSSYRLEKQDRLVFVAGSLRKREDKIFAQLILRSLAEKLDVFFVLVPRHMKDVTDFSRHLKAREIEYSLWSELEGQNLDSKNVLLVDAMGKLTDLYALADLAFVGGSLVSIGGHDPLEPASLGKPVIFGPFMNNASLAAEVLVKSGGARKVADSDELLDMLREAICHREALPDRGEKCRQALRLMAGVSEKVAKIIIKC